MFYGSNARTFKYAKKLREEMTDEEMILWRHLSSSKLKGFRFKRQHPLRNYIADFYSHKARLVIEVDGGIHEQRQQILRDKERTEKIEDCGCRVIRFSNDDIRYRLPQVLKSIEQYLETSAGQPPLQGRQEG